MFFLKQSTDLHCSNLEIFVYLDLYLTKIMKLLFATLVITLIFPVLLNASNYNTAVGGRSAALAYTSVTLNDFWSVHNNQAGLAYFNHIAVGFYYENRFMVKELGLRAGAFVLPTNSGVFGLNYNYFGYSKYSEQKIGLAYARAFGEHFSAGLQLDYLTTRIAEDYGSKNTFTFELGIRTKLSENFVIAAHVYNPIGVKIENEYNERIPTIFKLGLSYHVSDKLLLAIETEKDLIYKPLLRGGIEYKIVEQAIVRIGYSTLPSTTGSQNFSISSLYAFGFGLNLKKLVIDFSSTVHQTLGWSSQISIIYKFK